MIVVIQIGFSLSLKLQEPVGPRWLSDTSVSKSFNTVLTVTYFFRIEVLRPWDLFFAKEVLVSGCRDGCIELGLAIAHLDVRMRSAWCNHEEERFFAGGKHCIIQ